MKANKKPMIAAGAVILYIITIILYFIRKEQSQDGWYELIYTMTSGMQIRAILGCTGLFSLGYISLVIIHKDMKGICMFLLSYPFGIALWSVVGVLALLLGIPFNLVMMLSLLAAVVIIMAVLCRPQLNISILKRTLFSIFIFGAIAAIASTGMFFTMTSHDYYYYFDSWGKSLVLEGALTSDFKTFLLATGLMPALISAFAYMINVDCIYTFFHSLSICFAGFFAYAVYAAMRPKRLRLVKSIMTAAILYCLPPFLLLNGWIISNTLCMYYLFFIVYFIYEFRNSKRIPRDYGIPLLTMVCMFTLFRSDSGIFLCCTFVCAASTAIDNKEILWKLIFPGFILLCLFYSKNFILFGTEQSGMYLNINTIGMIILFYIGVILYYSAIRHKRWSLVEKNYKRLVMMGLCAISILLMVLFPQYYVNNINNVLYNIFTPEQFWGTTGILVIMASTWLLMRRKPMNLWIFLSLVIMVTTIDLGVLRGTMIGVARQGFGDSFNRQLISILPIFLFGVYTSWIGKEEKRIEPCSENWQKVR